MGIAKQLKDEIENCPPVLVLTGRADDAWLASWSRAGPPCPTPSIRSGWVKRWSVCCARRYNNRTPNTLSPLMVLAGGMRSADLTKMRRVG